MPPAPQQQQHTLSSTRPQIPPDDRRGFRPSLAVRGAYAGTRHSRIDVAGQSYPGLFSIHGYGRDTALFAAVIVLELLGLWLLVYGYWERNGIVSVAEPGAWLPFSLAVAALLLDLLAAVFRHWPFMTRLNLYENRRRYPVAQRKTDDAPPVLFYGDLQWRSYLERQHGLAFYRAVSWLCAAVIVALALLKMSAIQLFLPGDLANLRMPITVSYLICAFLHIFVTGEFLSATIVKWGFPPFVPLFQKGEMQEKRLHLSGASKDNYLPKVPYPTENFLPFECLMDGDSPFDIHPVVIKDDPNDEQRDGAYHVLYIEPRNIPDNFEESLQVFGLPADALDRPLRDIHLTPEQWPELLSRLGAYPDTVRPGKDTVAAALQHAQNGTLRSLIDRNYVIVMYGLLRDEHLSRFVSDQPESAKAAVLRWVHYAQYQQLLRDN